VGLPTILTNPANGTAAFNPLVHTFSFGQSFGVANSNTFFALNVSTTNATLISYFVPNQIIIVKNGSYAGQHRIIDVFETSPGKYRLRTSSPFTGFDSASNNFFVFRKYDFRVFLYKQVSIGSIDLRATPNPNGILSLDVSSVVRRYFELNAPAEGIDLGLTLRYEVGVTGFTVFTPSVVTVYGFENLTGSQLAGETPIGNLPILYTGGVPVIYSKLIPTPPPANRRIMTNFISAQDETITTTQEDIEITMLSCQLKEVEWIGSSTIAALEISPSLPPWITAQAVGANVELTIFPCQNGDGDYLLEDYSSEDYITGADINSINGCFTFVFSDGMSPLFSLQVCVDSVSGIQEACPDDVLNFAFINKQGGWNSFALECNYIKGVTFGGDTTIVTPSMVLKRVEVRDVYEKYTVSAAVVSKVQLDLYRAMRESIQAYLFNEATQTWDIPVVMDLGEFQTYGNKFNQGESRVSFAFRVAEQIKVQTQ
jgi:hypothetical protein